MTINDKNIRTTCNIKLHVAVAQWNKNILKILLKYIHVSPGRTMMSVFSNPTPTPPLYLFFLMATAAILFKMDQSQKLIRSSEIPR